MEGAAGLKLAMVVRADSSGLGTLTWETARHLKPQKVLIVQNGVFQIFPERYSFTQVRKVNAHTTMKPEDIAWLLEDVDVLLSAETFYDRDLMQSAKAKGVKLALITMCEMSPAQWLIKPDLFICPSQLDMKLMPEPKVYLPTPVATDRLVWKKRTQAKHFIHTASHGGVGLRKGTPVLIEAMKHVKSDVKLTIYTWLPFAVKDPRIEVKHVNFENYWQIWREGDVLVYPQNGNGISLPLQEAFASGLGVITTNLYPFNEWVPKECLFEPKSTQQGKFGHGLQTVEIASIDPVTLAAKIDEMAGMDISGISEQGRRFAQRMSWLKWLPEYNKVLSVL